jgi:hypothetical protein
MVEAVVILIDLHLMLAEEISVRHHPTLLLGRDLPGKKLVLPSPIPPAIVGAMKFLSWAPLVLAGLALSGCVRMTSLSEVTPQGAVDRKITVKLTDAGMGNEKLTPQGLITFTTPGLWTLSTRTEKQDQILEASRRLPSGAEHGVDFVMNDGGKGKAQCQVKVIKRDDGLVEYTETWTWTGPKGTALSEQLNKDARQAFGARMKEAGYTEEEVDKVMVRVGKSIFRAVLGPAEPLLPTLVMDTGLAMRKLRVAMADDMEAALGEIKPSLPAPQRRELTVAILKDLTSQLENSRTAGPSEAQGGESASGQLVGLELAVAFPGTLVESNGVADPIDGRVYWNMYLEACEIEPVVLRAVFRP